MTARMLRRPLLAAALFPILGAAPALAVGPPVPLSVDGAVLVERNVRVGGSSVRGARVSVYPTAGCRGAPAATGTAEVAGRFTVAANGDFEPPFTISVRAALGEERSACIDVPFPALQPPPPERRAA
jgi:hypothetical protein